MEQNNPDFATIKIKKIPLNKLKKLEEKIQVMIEETTKKRKKLFYAVKCHPSDESFNWVDEETLVEMNDVNPEPFEKVITRHNWGYYGFFKPSFEEVVSQLNEKQIKECDSFTTEYAGNQHLGITRLYKRIKQKQTNSIIL